MPDKNKLGGNQSKEKGELRAEGGGRRPVVTLSKRLKPRIHEPGNNILKHYPKASTHGPRGIHS